MVMLNDDDDVKKFLNLFCFFYFLTLWLQLQIVYDVARMYSSNKKNNTKCSANKTKISQNVACVTIAIMLHKCSKKTQDNKNFYKEF